MTHLTSVSVLGLAGRRKPFQVRLNRHVNVLWGLNGTGKTSLLRIMHGALSNEAASLVRVPFDAAEVDFYSRNRDVNVSRRLSKDTQEQIALDERLNSYDEAPNSTQWEGIEVDLTKTADKLQWVTSPPLDRPRVFAHRYLPTSRLADRAETLRYEARRRYSRGQLGDVLDEAMYDQVFASQMEDLWRDYSIRALSEIRSIQQRGLADILSAMLTPTTSALSEQIPDFSAEEAYETITRFLAEQDLKPRLGALRTFKKDYSNNPSLRHITAQITEIQRSVSEATQPQQQLADLLGSLYSGNKKIRFEGSRLRVFAGKSPIPLESLSSGEKQIMRLLIECVYARDNCLIVDEPEISLHVDWQHRLVQSLRTVNPGVQLILATHSPEVMANLSDDEIIEI